MRLGVHGQGGFAIFLSGPLSVRDTHLHHQTAALRQPGGPRPRCDRRAALSAMSHCDSLCDSRRTCMAASTLVVNSMIQCMRLRPNMKCCILPNSLAVLASLGRDVVTPTRLSLRLTQKICTTRIVRFAIIHTIPSYRNWRSGTSTFRLPACETLVKLTIVPLAATTALNRKLAPVALLVA